MDAKLAEDLNFAALRGKRWQASVDLLGDADRVRSLLFLTLAVEPLRFLSAWWMRRAREIDRRPDCIPLLDMLRPESSPLLVAQQYISTLLAAGQGADRLQLVWRYQGFDSYAEWFAALPLQVRELRRLLLCAAVGLHRRHAVTFKRMTWRLVQLCDPRVAEPDKDRLAQEWDASPACCLVPGFARQLKEMQVTSQELRVSPVWRQFLLQFGRLISQQVCDIEWRHGRNRGRSHQHGQTRFNTFVAEATLAEARLQHAARAVLRERGSPGPGGRLLGHPAGLRRAEAQNKPRQGHGLLRAQTPQEIHRWDWMRQQKALGSSFSAAQAGTWEAWRQAYEGLPQEQRQLYEERSVLSKTTARANRKRRRDSMDSQQQRRQQADVSLPLPSGAAQAPALTEADGPAAFGWPQVLVGVSSFHGHLEPTVSAFCQVLLYIRRSIDVLRNSKSFGELLFQRPRSIQLTPCK